MTLLDAPTPTFRAADARTVAGWVLAVCGVLLAVFCGARLSGVVGQVHELHWLRDHGTRFTGVVVDEGLTRPDGSMTAYWVRPVEGGADFFVDATWSPTPVTATGQRIDVTVDPGDRATPGLPVDSLHHGWVVEGLEAGFPSGSGAALAFGGAVLLLRRPAGSLQG